MGSKKQMRGAGSNCRKKNYKKHVFLGNFVRVYFKFG